MNWHERFDHGSPPVKINTSGLQIRCIRVCWARVLIFIHWSSFLPKWACLPTSDFTSKMIQMHQKYSIFGNNFGDVCYAHDVNGSQSPLHPRWVILIIFCSGIKSTPRIKLFCPLLAGIESLISFITHNELTWKIWSCFTACQNKHTQASD